MNYLDPNLISNTLGSIYGISDLKIRDVSLGQILDFFSSLLAHDGFRSDIKFVSFFITITLLTLLIILFFKLTRLTPIQIDLVKEISPPPSASSSTDARWQEILRHISSTREAEWKFAVIEADKLVNEILKISGFPGETLGERLMNTDKARLVSIDSLWEAHKIRNRLAHDSNYFLRYSEAKRAVILYEKTLRELGILS